MVRYLFTYTYIGHWEHSIDHLQQHTLSLSLDVSTEKSVALYITIMGRLKVYTSLATEIIGSILEVVKIECRQVGIMKPCRAVARGVKAVCSNPPFDLHKILYTIQWPVHHIIGYHRSIHR